MTERIGVIGAGAWGTALAMLLADKGHDVTLWMYEKDLAEETARTRENRVYLPGFTLPGSITVTSSLDTTARDKQIILSVCSCSVKERHHHQRVQGHRDRHAHAALGSIQGRPARRVP
jgi:glycerol-3-phosphate dehydrogenase (NAD(P)+)